MLEVSEKRKRELINISLEAVPEVIYPNTEKPLYLRRSDKYISVKPILKEKTPNRECGYCETLVYGKAVYCVDHRYSFQRKTCLKK